MGIVQNLSDYCWVPVGLHVGPLFGPAGFLFGFTLGPWGALRWFPVGLQVGSNWALGGSPLGLGLAWLGPWKFSSSVAWVWFLPFLLLGQYAVLVRFAWLPSSGSPRFGPDTIRIGCPS